MSRPRDVITAPAVVTAAPARREFDITAQPLELIRAENLAWPQSDTSQTVPSCRRLEVGSLGLIELRCEPGLCLVSMPSLRKMRPT